MNAPSVRAACAEHVIPMDQTPFVKARAVNTYELTERERRAKHGKSPTKSMNKRFIVERLSGGEEQKFT